MSSNMSRFLKTGRVKHNVAHVTSWRQPQLLINGAKCTEDIDNGALVEVSVVNGEMVVKYATASATLENTMIMMTPEEVIEKVLGEQICDFFNAKDEPATPAYLETGLSFQTSMVENASSVTEGSLLVWDATKKKYAVKATPATTDLRVFRCTSVETDERYLVNGLTSVELTVIR